MRHRLIVLLAVSFLIACSSSKPSTDIDMTTMDGDTAFSDSEGLAQIDEATVDSMMDGVVDDAVLVSDTDTIDPDCPPLIEVQFPYYKEDGTIHFCRPCDTPTEKDPQCVTNLWKEANLKLTTDHPEADCYPYPCNMPNLKPMTKGEVEAVFTTYAMHECDLMLTNYGWDTDSTRGQIKHWNLSGGKVGFVMYNVSLDIREYLTMRKYFVYDITTKKYQAQGPGNYGFAYYQGNAFLFFNDSRSIEMANAYDYLGYFTSDGTYRVVFNKPIYSIVYTPILNEKWVFANITFQKGGTSTMYYARVGEWKWTALGTGVAYYPDVKGDLLGFYDNGEQGYICDLSQKPTSVEKCWKVNRTGEPARDVVFDEVNDGVAAYTNLSKVFLVRYDKEPIEQTELFSNYTGKSDQFLGFIVNALRDKVLMYTEAYFYGGSTYGGRLCFYRLDTKQHFCMNKMVNDKQYGDSVVYNYGDAEFESDYVLYQKLNNSPIILRDMKCYCEKEGVCPFEGMVVKETVASLPWEREATSAVNPRDYLLTRPPEDTCSRLVGDGDIWGKDGFCGTPATVQIVRSSYCPQISGDPRKEWDECIEWVTRNRDELLRRMGGD